MSVTIRCVARSARHLCPHLRSHTTKGRCSALECGKFTPTLVGACCRLSSIKACFDIPALCVIPSAARDLLFVAPAILLGGPARHLLSGLGLRELAIAQAELVPAEERHWFLSASSTKQAN